MSSENALLELLGSARHQTYIDAAAGNPQRAAELYEWSNKLAGAWHSHIAYVEVAVRNAIDRQLCTWNASQVRPDGTPYSGDWTRANERSTPSSAGASLKPMQAQPMRQGDGQQVILATTRRPPMTTLLLR